MRRPVGSVGSDPSSTGRGLVRSIIGGPVAVQEADPRGFAVELSALFPEERRHIAGAVEKRQREFTAGRLLARAAMRQLGFGPRAIGVGGNRQPVWPGGLTGSISHTDAWCAVAIASSRHIRALGIDVEDDSPLKADLWPRICTRQEMQWLEGLPAPQRGLIAKLLFSAKESAYKAQYCVTGRFLDFDAMRVELRLEGRSWRATFSPGYRPPECPWDALEGRWIHGRGLIATAVAVERAAEARDTQC